MLLFTSMIQSYSMFVRYGGAFAVLFLTLVENNAILKLLQSDLHFEFKSPLSQISSEARPEWDMPRKVKFSEIVDDYSNVLYCKFQNGSK